ncbi:fimbrial protein [Serratia fonticola]|uniref:fimbrial protein n=1 Tax=Serratia fonticola TaxID=47917 RepID=UPI0021AD862C|nr:fimbrial protein [Serratia fonticola]
MIKLTQALLLLVLVYVNTAVRAQGTVKLQGAILESACAISPDNAFQTVELGTIPLKTLERNGISQAYPFKIRLINCALSDDSGDGNKSIEVTFSGFNEGHTGPLRNSGLRLLVKDEQGHQVTPGIPLTDIPIYAGEMILKYNIFLVASNKRVIAGSYYTTINMVVSYR